MRDVEYDPNDVLKFKKEQKIKDNNSNSGDNKIAAKGKKS